MEAGHYVYCPRCGFNTPLKQGEVVTPELLHCPGCGHDMDTTDRPPAAPPLY